MEIPEKITPIPNKKRLEQIRKDIISGKTTLNEARAEVELPPIDGGDAQFIKIV